MIEVQVNDPVTKQMLSEHRLEPDVIHTNLVVGQCACSTAVVTAPPIQAGLPDGGTCFRCGGMTVRTGTCTTCTSCGETGGCG